MTAVAVPRTAPAGQAGHTLRLTLHGTINAVQSWSTSFWFSYSGGGETTPGADTVAAGLAGSSQFAGAIDNFIESINAYQMPNTLFTGWTVTVFGESGTNPSIGLHTEPSALAGNSNSPLPPECAVVASLRTGFGGASFRGRAYLPLTGLALDSTGQITQANAQAIATKVAAFISSINGDTFDGGSGGLNYGLECVVNSVQLGVTNKVHTVVVDTRMDSQRRREDKLPGLAFSAATSN